MLRIQENGRVLGSDGLFLGQQLSAPRTRFWIELEFEVALPDSREDSLQGIVVRLRDGIEFVSVAAGAVCGSADEGGHRLSDDVVAIKIVEGDGSSARAAEFERARAEETESRPQVRLSGVEDLRGELFANEVIPGHILIEALDDIIAEGPGMRPKNIVLAPVGVSKVNGVEPVAGPSFAVAGRVQQLVDKVAVSTGILVCDKEFHLVGGWWQAVQIEGESPDEGAAIGRRSRGEIVLPESRLNEGIDRIGGGRCGGGKGRTLEGHKRPPVPRQLGEILFGDRGARIGGAARHPVGQDGDLLVRQFLLGRHFEIGVRVADPLEEQALLRLARNNRRASLAALLPAAPRIKGEPSLDLSCFV